MTNADLQNAKFSSKFSAKAQKFLWLLFGIFNIKPDLSRASGVRVTIDVADGDSTFIQVSPYGAGPSASYGPVSISQTASPPLAPVTITEVTLTAGYNASFSLTQSSGDRLVAKLKTPSGRSGHTVVCTRVDGTHAKLEAFREDGTTRETSDAGTYQVMILGQTT